MITCNDCGVECKPAGIMRGYVRIYNKDDSLTRLICYTCAALYEKRDMILDGRWTGYLFHSWKTPEERMTTKPTIIANWTGHLSFVISKAIIKVHSIEIWFRGPDGKIWHGKGGETPNNDKIECLRTRDKWIKMG
jgi:hypothetical protein